MCQDSALIVAVKYTLLQAKSDPMLSKVMQKVVVNSHSSCGVYISEPSLQVSALSAINSFVWHIHWGDFSKSCQLKGPILHF